MSTASIVTMGQGAPSLHPTALESIADCETPAISPTESPTALHDNAIVKRILTDLNKQSDLVIDFSSLKTCLNPLGIEESEEQDLDYEDLVWDLIEKHTEKLPDLEKLTVRRLLKSSKPLGDEQFDRYVQISHGIMQMSCLSELDLCNLPDIFHDQIQLWNLHNLKTLSITNSQLKSFPGSVGRLDKLEELDLSNNKLCSLPITLAFCKELKTLDLHSNSFRQLPGVILKLGNLTTLRRLQNPLTPIYECHSPRYTRKITDNKSKSIYQPISLQASCTTVIFTSQVDYWGTEVIGPLQCKTLDRLATQFTICDNCNRMLTEQANTYKVEVLLVTFAELSGVPFLLNACNETCQNKLMETYGQMNMDLQERLDKEYDEKIKQAHREMGTDAPVPRPQNSHRRKYRTHRYTVTPRRKRCSIM